MHVKKFIYGVSLMALLSTFDRAWGQDQNAPLSSQAPNGGNAVSEVIVTGTRQTGIKAADSAAPIQVVGAQALIRGVGEPDLISALSQNVPSLTEQALGGDLANVTLSARLRGLSPNDTLVLVDGKRRHGTANLAVLGGPYQGGAAPDLNFIPVDSIDHVEVLTDGAAAQYGTDAIAGVVNIITKKNTSGGNIIATGGQYYANDGTTGDVAATLGFAPIQNSYFDITAETHFHGHSDRGNADPRIYNHDGINNVGPGGPNVASLNFPGAPYLNHISGDALYHLNTIAFEAGYRFGDDGEFYTSGTYGHKNAQAFENYRVPNRAPTIYTDGFNPKEEILEDDYQYTAGVKDRLLGFNLDLSTTYGSDRDQIHTENSANDVLAATEGSTQTDFYDGAFVATEWTENLDISRQVPLAFLPKPVNIAGGVEERHDFYEIDQGEPSSYAFGGAQSFPGYAPLSGGKHERDNFGIYLDGAFNPVAALQVDLAGRYEHYTDFGDTTVGKVTGRYDFNPAIAVRGTISTGFRAPTLAEEFYTNVNVGPTTAFGQFAPNSVGSTQLGINGLKPETSHNYSGGLVFHPIPKFTATVDAYYIKIENRIVGSGDIYATGDPSGVNSAAVGSALTANGFSFDPGVTQTGIDIFANGLTTATDGLEAVSTYSESYGLFGHVDWSLSGAYNNTRVTHVDPSPASIAPQVLYNDTAISILQSASPKFKIIAGAVWNIQKVSVNFRETVYGKSSEVNLGDDGVEYTSTIKTTAITDLEFDYQLPYNIRLAIGANNLFNQEPNKENPSLTTSLRLANDNGAVTRYPDFSPFGIDGGYYYGKVTFTF